jgi:3-hydroxybutyryl-CoA dehydratase
MPIQVGDTTQRSKTITDADIRAFAEVSGDHNPIHLDDDYAAKSPFGRRVVYGILVTSVISAALANDLPGEGTIYMAQSVKFKKPVFIGDTVTATLTVTAYREDKRIATLQTNVTNQDGAMVIEGEATVLVPEGR